MGLVYVTNSGNIFYFDSGSNWTKTSEKLPSLPYVCLLTLYNANIVTGHYDGRQWKSGEYCTITEEIKAWQPMPAPYQEGL